MTALASAVYVEPDREAGRSPAARILVAAVLALAVVGAVLTAVLVVTAPPPEVVTAVGQPVTLPAGSFAVTRAATTMVPMTQGPPTAAKMAGTVGTDRLQVWVTLTATDAAGLAFAPEQFRLVPKGAAPAEPSGSTLGDGVLPRDGAISGQVWFDDVDALDGASLEYTAADGRIVRVDLDGVATLPQPEHAPSHG